MMFSMIQKLKKTIVSVLLGAMILTSVPVSVFAGAAAKGTETNKDSYEENNETINKGTLSYTVKDINTTFTTISFTVEGTEGLTGCYYSAKLAGDISYNGPGETIYSDREFKIENLLPGEEYILSFYEDGNELARYPVSTESLDWLMDGATATAKDRQEENSYGAISSTLTFSKPCDYDEIIVWNCALKDQYGNYYPTKTGNFRPSAKSEIEYLAGGFPADRSYTVEWWLTPYNSIDADESVRVESNPTTLKYNEMISYTGVGITQNSDDPGCFDIEIKGANEYSFDYRGDHLDAWYKKTSDKSFIYGGPVSTDEYLRGDMSNLYLERGNQYEVVFAHDGVACTEYFTPTEISALKYEEIETMPFAYKAEINAEPYDIDRVECYLYKDGKPIISEMEYDGSESSREFTYSGLHPECEYEAVYYVYLDGVSGASIIKRSFETPAIEEPEISIVKDELSGWYRAVVEYDNDPGIYTDMLTEYEFKSFGNTDAYFMQGEFRYDSESDKYKLISDIMNLKPDREYECQFRFLRKYYGGTTGDRDFIGVYDITIDTNLFVTDEGGTVIVPTPTVTPGDKKPTPTPTPSGTKEEEVYVPTPTPTPEPIPVQVQSDVVKEDTAYDNLENFKRIDLTDSALSTTITVANQTYSGKELRPAVTVKITQNGKSVTLTEGTDYIRSYSNNVDAGTALVTIKGNGLYTGAIAKEFTISKKSINKFVIAASSVKKDDPVDEITNNISVYDGTNLLQAGTDYVLDTSKVNTSVAGKATVVVNGAGNYTGTRNVSVPVIEVSDSKYLISSAAFNDAADGVREFTGKAAKFNASQITVFADDGSEVSAANYSISAKNVTNVGSGYVLIKGKGKFKGQVTIPVEIKAPEVTLNVTNPSNVTFNGKLQHPKVTVTASVGGKKVTLKANKDYVITYTNNLHASTDAEKASLQVTGIGNYVEAEAVEKEFTIKQQNIKKAVFKGTKTKGLTGTYNKHLLIEGVDYKIEGWEDNKAGTKSKATITGLRDYTGTGVKTFKVK